MAQQGAPRGPMSTFDSLLTAYLDYLALADDAARSAFLRERVGFKASPGETFKDGPGGLGVFARLFDAVLRIATTGMVGRYYGANEDLGLANVLGAFEGDALGLAHTALADTPASDNAVLRLHGALLSLLRAYLPPRSAKLWREACDEFVFPQGFSQGGRSLFGFGTSNVLSPSLRWLKHTGSSGLILPHGAGSSRSWRTRRHARIRLGGSRG